MIKMYFFVVLISIMTIQAQDFNYNKLPCGDEDREREYGCKFLLCDRETGFWYMLQPPYYPENCFRCHCNDDPHCETFDQVTVELHIDCEYTMTQDVPSYSSSPRGLTVAHGIYANFEPCYGTASCVNKTTFIDRNALPDPLMIEVHHEPSGVEFSINGGGKIHISAIPDYDNIYDLGDGHYIGKTILGYSDALVIIGNDDYLLEATSWNFNIWASDILYNTLGGLCGHFDGNPIEDFIKSDGSLALLPDFAKSWLTIAPNNDDNEDYCETTYVCKHEDEYRKNECEPRGKKEKLGPDAQFIEDCVKDYCFAEQLAAKKADKIFRRIDELETNVAGIERDSIKQAPQLPA